MRKLDGVSIIIPVYNEAAHLPACLDAIAAQTVRPLEVLVIDNNSTDDSVAVASKYDFIRVISEPQQGVIFARDTGFNNARGSILGRIDADTIISPDWVETVGRIFQDSSVGAVTGRATYYDMGWARVMGAVDFGIRTALARVLGREVTIQGANMAIRRKVWRDVRLSVCRRGGMHEDLDLSVHTNWHGYNVVFDPSLKAGISCRQAASAFRDFVRYSFMSPRTYALHGLKSRRYMYPVVILAICSYGLLKLLHRGYDKDRRKFSWALLFTVPEQRVNPATYVDY